MTRMTDFGSVSGRAFAICLGMASAMGANAQTVGADAGGEIIVTAQKRAQSQQDVPISLAVISADKLEQQNVTTLSGLQSLTPNLRFTVSTGTPQIYVRGVGGGGRNVGFDPRVGVYVDGVYIGDTGSLDAVLVGLERVEVLRGPQGFLFGENTDAGAISLVTRAPSATPSGSFSVGYGRYNRLEATARINVPLASDVFASLAATSTTRDGNVTNLFNGRKLNKIDNQGVRGRIRINASERTVIDFGADYSRSQNNLVVGEMLTNMFGSAPSGAPSYTVNQNEDELDRRTSMGASMTVTHETDGLSLTSITAYRKSIRRWVTDTEHGPASIINVIYKDNYSTFSQELRAASSDATAPLRYLAGIYYASSHNSSVRRSDFGADSGVFGFPVGGTQILTPTIRTDRISGYASLDYDVVPNLTLNAAGRLSYEKRDLETSQYSDFTSAGYVNFSGFTDALSETHFIPSVGFQYKPDRNLMFYGKYSRGVKSGGFNVDYMTVAAPNGRPYPFSSESVQSYEAGVKSEWLDRRLRVNLSVFLNRFKDYQLFQNLITPSGLLDLRLLNAGSVETWGPELEINVQPTKNLSLNLSGAWLSAKYTSFKNGGGIGVDYDGNHLEYAPKWTLNASADYRTDIDLIDRGYAFGNINYAYKSNQYADASNATFYRIGETNDLNLVVGFGGALTGSANWELSAALMNVTNGQQLNNISVDGLGALLGFRQVKRSGLVKLKVSY